MNSIDWNKPEHSGWRRTWHVVIFEAETAAGKAFDIALLWLIIFSIFVVMLESVESFWKQFALIFSILEWFFTLLFTLEYLVRLLTVKHPWRYAVSFFGVVDLLSIIPTYLSLIFVGSHYLLVIRTLRLLRVFRVLKLGRMVSESQALLRALQASRHKIMVFLSSVLALVVILGTMMYMIEGGENGFSSIPRAIYWAIVTLTTVGYGDIAPQTVLGQTLASLVMILGYAIIAVPTGIVTSELTQIQQHTEANIPACPNCRAASQETLARFCKFCGYAFAEKRPQIY